jgi:branched-chain amino acid transport system permease protein
MSYLPCGTYFQSYDADQKWWRTRFIKGKMIAMVLMLLVIFPWLSQKYDPQWLSVAYTINYYVLAALGVQLLIGYCGQVTLGHAAFVAVGGYCSAMMVLFVPWPKFMVTAGLVYPISMVASALLAGLWSVLFGLPSARVKGFYLIMTTMAAQWITVPFVITHYVSRIGSRGQSFPVPAGTIKILWWDIDSDLRVYYFSVILVAICMIIMGNLLRSKIGRAWIAIRDNDIAAETMGVNIVAYKLLAFFVAGCFAGIAGSFYISALYAVSPENYEWSLSLIWVGAILIGGVGSLQGVVFGSAFIILVFKFLEMGIYAVNESLITYYPSIGWMTTKVLYFREAAVGLAIIFFVIYEPNGISYRYWQLKNYFNLWPFSYTGKGH